MISFNLKRRFSLYIIVAFVVCTILGTLTHELGHIVVAKYLGYETYLSYGSMSYTPNGYNNDKDVKEFEKLNTSYVEQGITNPDQLNNDDLEHFNSLINSIQEKFPFDNKQSLLVTIGGPTQTILTCIIGLLILFFRKSKQRATFKYIDWIGVFLGLFVLREVFNTVMALFDAAFFDTADFTGDEFDISKLLGFNQWVIPILTMIVGLLISVYIIFKVIPASYRFSFIISGLVGGILGFGIWFGFLGQLVFPAPISF